MELGPFKVVAGVAVIIGTAIWSERITAYNPPPGAVYVVYWEKWSAFEADAMRAVVDEFNREHQGKIFVDFLSVSGVDSKTLMAVAGGDPPDVAGLYGANVAQYADDQAVLPLDDFCKQAGITRDQYIKAYIDICDYNGHLMALPSTPASVALHYNVDMLREAGIQKPPTTIEEMDADAEKMTKRDANGKVVQAGFIPQEPGWWNYGWGAFFGGSLYDGHGHLTLLDPGNLRAFEWIYGYAKKYPNTGLQTFRNGFGGFNSPQNAFMTGQDAMELQGVWMANFIEKNNPKLHWDAVPFPYPADRPDLKDTTIADLDILTIPRGARHPKEAFEFIKFVQTQKGMELLCMGQHKNTPLKAVSAGFYEHHPNPKIRLFNELPMGRNTWAVPKIGIWPELSQELTSAVDAVSLMKKKPRQALQDIQDRMQPKLDEHLQRMRMRGLIP